MLLINAKKIFRKLLNLTASLKKHAPKLREKHDPVQAIYRRYEHYLKTVFGETRKLTETDREMLSRLKMKPHIPVETIEKMESFVGQYHAVRFGFGGNIDLEKMIEEL